MVLHEECGVFGIISPVTADVAGTAYYGLYALQHRGQESCGIVVNDDGVFSSHKDLGEVSGYEVEETPSASGYAGYKDWFIMTYDRPGYTIEAGRGVSPLPMSQFDRIYEDNKRILLGGMTQI